MSHVVVFIAVGSLDPEKFPRRDRWTRTQRGMNHDTHEAAEREGLQRLDERHWSTFTVEKRFYRSGDGLT